MFDELKQKALKITEALYRTTDLFSDAEPLKWSLRQNALDVLSSNFQDTVRLEELVKNIAIKLELAASGTFISKTNFDVIKRAYDELIGQALSFKGGYQNLLDNIVSDNNKITTSLQSKGDITVLSDKHNLTIVSGVARESKLSLTERQGLLLEALKAGGLTSVGDLAKSLVVAGIVVSEKTVQRELTGLVASGAIKQEGEKRWRRYFISPDAIVGAPPLV